MATVTSERCSAQTLAEDLERWLADEPVGAYREPLAARCRRWLRKHPRSVATLFATVVVGVASLGVTAAVVAAKNHELEAAYLAENQAKGLAERKRIEAESASAAEAQARARAEGVTRQLVKAFRSPDPARDGRTITMAEVLDRSTKELKVALSDDPQTKAALLHAIGDAYLGLGLYRESIAAYEPALALRSSPDASKRDRIDAFELANGLGAAYFGAGQLPKALALSQEMYRQCEESLGPEHPTTLVQLNNMAQVYQTMGQIDQALPLLEKSLRMLEAREGPEHALTLAPRSNLATALESAGQIDRALPLFERSLALIREREGADHPNTIMVMNNVGRAYAAAGRIDEALPLLEESAAIARAKFGPSSQETWSCLQNLVLAYDKAQRIPEALELYREVVELKREKLGATHAEVMSDLYTLGNEYFQAGETAKAFSVFDEFIALRRELCKDDEARLAHTLGVVAQTFLKHRQPAAAEQRLRESLEKIERASPADWRKFVLRTMLGTALSEQQKYEEAESCLLEGYEGLLARYESIPAKVRNDRLREALERLATHCDAVGNSEEAAKWRSEQARYPQPPPTQKVAK